VADLHDVGAHDLWGERSRPRPGQLVFDVVSAAVFTALSVVPAAQQGGLLVAAAAAMGLALAVRRLAWPAMVALATVAGVCQLVAGELTLLADLGFVPVFFVLGAHPRAAVRRFGLAAVGGSATMLAVAVGAGGVDAVGGVTTPVEVGGSAAMAVLVAGGGWAAGYVRWQSRARVSAQVQAGLEQERARIAADMHDLVAHTWAVVAAQADGARYALGGPEGQRQAAESLDLIADTARASIADLRDLLAELRYEETAAPPGRSAHEAVLDRMRASGMELRLTEHGGPTSSSVGVVVAAQRLFAESLTNALKHGDLGHPVDVEEDWRDGYRLVVRNRRRGSARPESVGTGHGVAGMRERVGRAGGTLTAGVEGDDWVVRAALPDETGA
jgi:signal transduction histidine kinase